jgi:RES domain-containing protein
MATLWRVVKRQHVGTAFDGKAAQRFGGRWNLPGRRAVYASATKSLAMLEILVHLDVGTALPEFAAFSFQLDDALIDRLPARLPREWRSARGMLITQQLGDDWLAANRNVALSVPSAVVPEESNYVLNPAHPAFADLKFGRALPFTLDARLR